MIRAVQLLPALALLGCAELELIRVDGFRVNRAQWDRDITVLGRRFAFEARCQGPLTFTLLKASGGAASSTGVSGCDQRAVYARTYPMGWVMDSSSVPSPGPR